MGTAYAGFQSQPGKTTVQSVLQRAIQNVTGEPTTVVASGRTDAGAHALAQVIAFRSATNLTTEVLGRAINAHLPDDITVTSVAEAKLGFHPRFDALSRTYRYLIWNRSTPSPFWVGRSAFVRPRLDVRRMNEAAQLLQGTHDFGAFVASSASGDRTRTMYSARCWREDDLVAIELEATGFMQQMVRAIAGTIIQVGLGRLTIDEFAVILASTDRTRAAETAPACGLYLREVHYEAQQTSATDNSAGAQHIGLPATGPQE